MALQIERIEITDIGESDVAEVFFTDGGSTSIPPDRLIIDQFPEWRDMHHELDTSGLDTVRKIHDHPQSIQIIAMLNVKIKEYFN